MRIIKNTQNDIESIVGEMINITYGMTIYKDNKLLSEFKKNHNEYIINDVSYNIQPNIGLVFLLTNKDITETAITNKFYDMSGRIMNKIELSKIEVGTIDTGNNLLITDPSVNPYISIGFQFNRPLNETTKHLLLYRITWFIYSMELVNSLPIIGWNSKYNKTNNIYSLSSIIYDDLNYFKLINNYKSPDYPSIKDCESYDKGLIHDNSIIFNLESGPLLEIVKICKPAEIEKIYATRSFKGDLYYAKWEQLVIYENNNDLIPWYKQLELGLLENVKDVKTNELESLKVLNGESNTKKYKCFITGVPIYEDCYVFDICSIMIEEIIESCDLHKYPGAHVISDVSQQDINTRNSNTKFKSVKGVKTKKAKANTNTKLDKNKSKANPNAKAKPNATATTTTTTTQTENNLEHVEETKQYIKIKYKRIFDTPKCILVSPFYVHFLDKKYSYTNIAKEFENKTNTKILVYRSYCPTTTDQIIASLNTTELHKKILKEMDKEMIVNGSQIKTASCQFNHNSLTTTDLLQNKNFIQVHSIEYRY